MDMPPKSRRSVVDDMFDDQARSYQQHDGHPHNSGIESSRQNPDDNRTSTTPAHTPSNEKTDSETDSKTVSSRSMEHNEARTPVGEPENSQCAPTLYESPKESCKPQDGVDSSPNNTVHNSSANSVKSINEPCASFMIHVKQEPFDSEMKDAEGIQLQIPQTVNMEYRRTTIAEPTNPITPDSSSISLSATISSSESDFIESEMDTTDFNESNSESDTTTHQCTRHACGPPQDKEKAGHGGASSSTSKETDPSSSNPQPTQTSSFQNRSQQKKGVANDKTNGGNDRDGNDENEDGDGMGKQQKFKRLMAPKIGARFACPYFKYDPQKHRRWRSCFEHGFETIHRTKEHIYRQHAKPIHCPRCGGIFSSDEDLTAHSKNPVSCNVVENTVIDGLTKKQEEQLRSRKRPRRQTEEDKWRDIYRTLFYSGEDGLCPSPYWRPDGPETDEIIRQCSSYFQEHLPKRIKMDLESSFEQLDEHVRGSIEEAIVKIVQIRSEEVAQSFRAGLISPPPTPPHSQASVDFSAGLNERSIASMKTWEDDRLTHVSTGFLNTDDLKKRIQGTSSSEDHLYRGDTANRTSSSGMSDERPVEVEAYIGNPGYNLSSILDSIPLEDNSSSYPWERPDGWDPEFGSLLNSITNDLLSGTFKPQLSGLG
ncbi:hypothetical protein EJ08DRAFT_684094 [Tothia fuscella]|uniref:C2H2-type domain-containing protein n=1 Tax=Tothia fuscella TaxID=1048955 RepID=A0A9P4TS82_9PEZI|nr:hypothetical protein EJ08DRAFT_684094 [Tothia fuscella]